ncbi:TetR/AcrR family transcriptional regulator [Cryptosporangium sp. NPDC048952]|uniref:TetR/AcrR family transcriptional regulator n=1 Tax=Cryptosporangium sp. NPDC048952 TaxID=3363961 RepID=UPI003722BD11
MMQSDAEHTGEATSRRTQILDAAVVLFSRTGYHTATMEDIAEAVGIAKPTLYHYYKSKSDILADIHESFVRRVIAKHRSRAALVSSPRLQLLGMMQDIFEFLEGNASHVRVFYEQQAELAPAKRELIHDLRVEYTRAMEDVIEAGIDAGEIRKLDPVLVSRAIFGMCNWSYQWYRSSEFGSGADVAAFMWELIFGGIQGGAAPSGAAVNAKPRKRAR